MNTQSGSLDIKWMGDFGRKTMVTDWTEICSSDNPEFFKYFKKKKKEE